MDILNSDRPYYIIEASSQMGELLRMVSDAAKRQPRIMAALKGFVKGYAASEMETPEWTDEKGDA